METCLSDYIATINGRTPEIAVANFRGAVLKKRVGGVIS